jgi:hypothetical protein
MATSASWQRHLCQCMPVSRGNMSLRKNNKTLTRNNLAERAARWHLGTKQILNWIFVLILQHRGVSVMTFTLSQHTHTTDTTHTHTHTFPMLLTLTAASLFCF